MDVFVISLDRSLDRWKDLEKRAKSAGFNPIRFPAVDGTQLPASEIARLTALQTGSLPRLGPGEVACFLSHRALWQQFLKGTDDWVLILEDDVHFHRLTPLIQDTGWIPPDAEIVKCETYRRQARLGPTASITPNGIRLARLQSKHLGTAGYILSRSGAEKLVDLTEGLCEAVDQILFDPDIAGPGRFVIYQLDPAPVIQDVLLRSAAKRNFASTLSAERGGRPNKKLSPAAKFWREFKRLFEFRRHFAPLVCRLTSRDRIIRVTYCGDKQRSEIS